MSLPENCPMCPHAPLNAEGTCPDCLRTWEERNGNVMSKPRKVILTGPLTPGSRLDDVIVPKAQTEHLVYVGQREDLKWEWALVRPGAQEGKVLAQFDNLEKFGDRENGPCYGWHEFDRTEFDLPCYGCGEMNCGGGCCHG